jgi:hypothetical protein
MIGAWITIPQLWQVLAEVPKDRMPCLFLMGVAYGIGTAFNLSIHLRWGVGPAGRNGLANHNEYLLLEG